MSDQDLGDALLKLDLSSGDVPQAVQVERIIASDRNRVKWLTRLTVAMWFLAAAGALLIAVVGAFIFPAIAHALKTGDQWATAQRHLAGAGVKPNVNQASERQSLAKRIGPAHGGVKPNVNQASEGGLDHPNTPFLMLAKLTAVSILLGSLSFIVLVGAGLSTVLLVFRSRRATLRQINANLLRISEQLKAAGH